MSTGKAVHMMALGAALVVSTAGCASMLEDGPVHHVYEPEHPWHSYPAYATAGVVMIPLLVIALPICPFFPDGMNMHKSPVVGSAGAASLAVGSVVGGVFWVVGYPLEWLFPIDPRRGLPPLQDPMFPKPETTPAPTKDPEHE